MVRLFKLPSSFSIGRFFLENTRSNFPLSIFLHVFHSVHANTFLSDAEKYAVRVKSSISYPFAEMKQVLSMVLL